MKKNAKKKKLIAGIALWLSMIMAMPVHGDDTEIYINATNEVIPPNVLIIMDTSGSMSFRDMYVSSAASRKRIDDRAGSNLSWRDDSSDEAYDSSKTYPQQHTISAPLQTPKTFVPYERFNMIYGLIEGKPEDEPTSWYHMTVNITDTSPTAGFWVNSNGAGEQIKNLLLANPDQIINDPNLFYDSNRKYVKFATGSRLDEEFEGKFTPASSSTSVTPGPNLRESPVIYGIVGNIGSASNPWRGAGGETPSNRIRATPIPLSSLDEEVKKKLVGESPDFKNPGIVSAADYPSANHTIGGEVYVTYATANYINWTSSRMEVAKDTITDIVDTTDKVRFGLMRFSKEMQCIGEDQDPLTRTCSSGAESNPHTGVLVSEIADMEEDNGAQKKKLLKDIAELESNGETPLQRTLLEAGWYYARKGKYTEKKKIITADCQYNYIILVTDGAPDSTTIAFGDKNYIHDTKFKTKMPTNAAGGTTTNAITLADVAKYLYECGVGKGSDGEPHRVITHTIAFGLENETAETLLRETATAGNGNYYHATTAEALKEAFAKIMGTIGNTNSVFVSPVVPVNQQNRTFAGDRLYVGFFKPNSAGLWEGNLKQYALDSYGVIKDKNGNNATDADGQIKDNAQSYWSTTPDGSTVTKGGAGGVLNNMTARKLYTNLDETKALSDSANSFSKNNQALTNAKLGVGSDEDRETTIDTLLNGTTSSAKDGSLWKMGDVLHSTPAVVAYGNDSYIFVGTNRGVLHAFSDSDGEEEWGFIPEPQLPRLQKLWDAPYEHNYFVDGAPAVYRASGGDKTLLIGERRGGNNYYALNVTDIKSPKYKYAIPEVWSNSNSALAATMAQSWANPTVHKVKTNSSGQTANVFLLTGGYDVTHDTVVKKEDGTVDVEKSWRGRIPANAPDTKGNSVFMVNVDNGSVTALDSTHLEDGTVSIPHSIVDVAGFDYNDDAWTDRVYAGDLGGNIWAFEDHADPHDVNKKPNGKWTGKRLFVDDARRKIFYAPDVVLETGGEDMIFFGTGDRAAPKDTSLYDAGEYDRIYAIKNNWLVTATPDDSPDINLSPADLYDATENLIQDGNENESGPTGTAQLALDNKRGWYFDLNQNMGEKIISSVLVYNGVLYFTTYTPAAPVAPEDEDPCKGPSDLGTARLYAVDYRNGTAVLDFDEDNNTGGTVLARSDRCKEIGAAIPSSPVIAILEGKAVLFVGISGGIMSEDPLQDRALKRFYWKMPLE